MDLTVREAAALMGRSRRTVRAQVARGDLPGVKRNGHWRIPRQSLPLTEAQRRSLQSKADSVRQAVEEALPSRLAATTGQKYRSVADLEAFRRGAQVLTRIRDAEPAELPESLRERVTQFLEEALLALAEAVQQFDREAKREAIRRTRAGLARAVGIILLKSGCPPPEPMLQWVLALETEVMPAVAGFARWIDGLQGRRG